MSKSSIDRLFPYVAKGLVGTGAPVSIPHGLGAIPDIVIPILRDTIGAANQYTLGAHTTKNIVITVTNNAVFDLLAGVQG